MAMTFGTIIKDRSLRNMGIKNIFVCLMGTISFGFLFGMIALNFTQSWTNSLGSNNTYTWPTDMMRERGLVRITWVGTLVAFPSGCAVAISLLSGNDASLVGVAISVSLLPPAVNAVIIKPLTMEISYIIIIIQCLHTGIIMGVFITKIAIFFW